jgi:ABC-type molybdate transport system permease subunit
MSGAVMMFVAAASTTLPSLPLSVVTAVLALLVDLAISFYFIQDLYQPDRRVTGGDKTVWLVIILFGSVLGWMAYITFGRQG